MQVSVGSGHHIIESKLRISKRALRGLGNESHATKRSPKTIVPRTVIVLEPKTHVVRLAAAKGREDLIKKAIGTCWTGEECEASRVRITVDTGKRGISTYGPRRQVPGFKAWILDDVLCASRKGRARDHSDGEKKFFVHNFVGSLLVKL